MQNLANTSHSPGTAWTRDAFLVEGAADLGQAESIARHFEHAANDRRLDLVDLPYRWVLADADAVLRAAATGALVDVAVRLPADDEALRVTILPASANLRRRLLPLHRVQLGLDDPENAVVALHSDLLTRRRLPDLDAGALDLADEGKQVDGLSAKSVLRLNHEMRERLGLE